MIEVAALYVQYGGVYWGHSCVDAWDEKRDARQYRGPWPVVAHPPCQLWTNFAGLNYKRYGGKHNRPANDGGCFFRALMSVREFGGVLEHPAGSYAWNTFDLLKPQRGLWKRDYRSGDWVTEVSQSAYGHRARKRTWLVVCSSRQPKDLDWRDLEGSAQCGWFDRKKPTVGKDEASATPGPFAAELIRIALSSRH